MTEWLKGFSMISGAEIGGIVFLAVIVLGVLLYFFLKKANARAKVKEGLEVFEATQKAEKERLGRAKSEGKDVTETILGKGIYPCLCFRQGQILEWTKIPAPMGEVYQSDTSCPVSGGVYIVRETEKGEIVDYDPREVKVEIDKSPEWAWYATHWDIVPRVFSVAISVWKSPATWFAAAMIIVLFISTLAVVGG